MVYTFHIETVIDYKKKFLASPEKLSKFTCAKFCNNDNMHFCSLVCELFVHCLQTVWNKNICHLENGIINKPIIEPLNTLDIKAPNQQTT